MEGRRIVFAILLLVCCEIGCITADGCNNHNSCSSCQDFGCVWCKTKTDGTNGTKQHVSVCVAGDLRGPEGSDIECSEYYYYQCAIPAQNDKMYIIIIVCALVFIIAVIVLSVFLCCRFCCTSDDNCCTCCSDDEESDFDKHQKSSPREQNASANRAKEIEMRDYHTKHKALLEKCLEGSQAAYGAAGNEQQSEELTPSPSAPPILDPNTIAILDHSSPLVIPVYSPTSDFTTTDTSQNSPPPAPPGYYSTHHIMNPYQDPIDKPPTPPGTPPRSRPSTPPPGYY